MVGKIQHFETNYKCNLFAGGELLSMEVWMVIHDCQSFYMHRVTIEQQQFLVSLLKLLKNMAYHLAWAVIKVVKIMKLASSC